MKSTVKIYGIALLIMVALSVMAGMASAAAPVPANSLKVTQTTFALEGDSVQVAMNIDMSAARVGSRSSVLLTPVIEAPAVTKILPSVSVSGRNSYKAYKRRSVLSKGKESYPYAIKAYGKDAPVSYDYNVKVPYEKWMNDSRFTLHQEQCNCGGAGVPVSQNIMASTLDNRNIMKEHQMPELYQPAMAVCYSVPETEAVKVRSEAGKAFLDFKVGKSDIIPDFKDNALELNKIYTLIESVKDDPNATITGIVITGYASPEGSFNANLTLSQKRAAALKDHIRARYGFREDMFRVSGHGEDWETLDTLVTQSNIMDRDRVLQIMRTVGIQNGRESKLMALSAGATYKSMLVDMFPKLRRSDYELKYTVLPFTVEQGKEVFKTRPSTLSQNEMFLIAQTYEPGSEAFNEIFETAVRVFPHNDIAKLNAAANALNRKDLVSAGKYLSRVTKKDGAYYNNMGVLNYLKEDMAKAKEYFGKAAAMGNAEAAANIAEMDSIISNRSHMESVKKQNDAIRQHNSKY